MRVQLQLVVCHDDGYEETVTDIITLNKHNQHIEHLGLSLAESKQLLSALQRHLLHQQVTTFVDVACDVPGLREAAQAQGPRQPLVSHLVRHLYVLQSEVRALSLHTAQHHVVSAVVGAAHRAGGPGTLVYGSQVVLSGGLRAEPRCPPEQCASPALLLPPLQAQHGRGAYGSGVGAPRADAARRGLRVAGAQGRSG